MDFDCKDESKKVDEQVPKFGYRYIQATIFFFYLLVICLTRNSLSIAVVAMTERSSKNPNIPIYDWKDIDIILSSFYWTYVLLQLFSGYVFRLFGFKRVLLITMIINCFAFALIPICAAHFGSIGVVCFRMIQGLTQGFSYPACYTILGTWVPVKERSKLAFLIFSGARFGVILAMVITGYLSSSWLGWPSVFYSFSVLGIAWCIVWHFFGFESPAKHPRISIIEKNHIQHSLDNKDNSKKSKSIPIKAMMSSVPVWALIIGNMGNAWATSIIDLDIPMYLSKALGLDINMNGLVSSTPQFTQLIIQTVSAPLCDYIIHKEFVSLMNCRRFFHFLASIIPSILLVWLAYMSKDQITLAIVLLNLISGLNGLFLYSGYINHVDLTPNHAGALLGIENSFSMGIATTGPLFVPYIVTDLSDIFLWRHIFIIMAIVITTTSSVFMIFGSAKVQWWNSTKDKSSEPLTKIKHNDG
ncbi:putative inorganic phosphate cotransporter [Rhynchophorus ferrugineus]|uniref:Putative inorganic phosphate cotransporter n=1 Tax=Rhynchophorus ferrugineus TaxID=354439 RepID=A0A834HRM2_RHYFE|nr:hypothetical protein GWI33_020423 [Rhynchophorus ferrugineus]